MPTSISLMRLAPIKLQIASTFRGRLRLNARLLKVPRGTIARVFPVPTRLEAAWCTVLSPAATTTRSTPVRTRSAVRPAMLKPGSTVTSVNDSQMPSRRPRPLFAVRNLVPRWPDSVLARFYDNAPAPSEDQYTAWIATVVNWNGHHCCPIPCPLRACRELLLVQQRL